MTTYSCKETSLRENYPHEIVERDEAGNIVGTWTGYYNGGAYLVTLYPSYKNPFFKWGMKRPQKRKVSASYVRCAPRVSAQQPPCRKEDKLQRVPREVAGQQTIRLLWGDSFEP